MARKKDIAKESYEEELEFGALDDDLDDIIPSNDKLPIGRYAKTFMLPHDDKAYGNLLDMDKSGEATILSKQYCPCPKEGYVLVVCEFDINF